MQSARYIESHWKDFLCPIYSELGEQFPQALLAAVVSTLTFLCSVTDCSHKAPSGSAPLAAASSCSQAAPALLSARKLWGLPFYKKVLVLIVVVRRLLRWWTFDCDDISVSREDFWINKTKKIRDRRTTTEVADRVEISLETLVSPGFCASLRKWEHMWDTSYHCHNSKLLQTHKNHSFLVFGIYQYLPDHCTDAFSIILWGTLTLSSASSNKGFPALHPSVCWAETVLCWHAAHAAALAVIVPTALRTIPASQMQQISIFSLFFHACNNSSSVITVLYQFWWD